jgi:uncharacterized protein YndB with AHSA1/START domain
MCGWRSSASHLLSRPCPTCRTRFVARSVPAIVEPPPGPAGGTPRRKSPTLTEPDRGGIADLGSYIEFDGRPAVRFQRTYRHSIQRVWSAITDPDEMQHWFPSKGEIELHVGGTVTWHGDPSAENKTGTVLICDPPKHLAFTWGDHELHFQLDPVDDGHCRLTLIDVLAARDEAARNAAGWSVCLAGLLSHLAGHVSDSSADDGPRPWHHYYNAYLGICMPSGATIPGP